jgi:hypothetical protein
VAYHDVTSPTARRSRLRSGTTTISERTGV